MAQRKSKMIFITLVAFLFGSTQVAFADSGSKGTGVTTPILTVSMSDELTSLGSGLPIGLRSANSQYALYVSKDRSQVILTPYSSSTGKVIYTSASKQLGPVELTEEYAVFGDSDGMYIYNLANRELKNIAPVGQGGDFQGVSNDRVCFNTVVYTNKGYSDPPGGSRQYVFDLKTQSFLDLNPMPKEYVHPYGAISGDWILSATADWSNVNPQEGMVTSISQNLYGYNIVTHQSFKSPVFGFGLAGFSIDSKGTIYTDYEESNGGSSTPYLFNLKSNTFSPYSAEKGYILKPFVDAKDRLFYISFNDNKAGILKMIDLNQAQQQPVILGNLNTKNRDFTVDGDAVYWWSDDEGNGISTLMKTDLLAKPNTITVGLKVGSTQVTGTADRSLDVAPYIQNDRTMVPLRFITETLGSLVKWNESAQRITIINASHTVVVTIGSTEAIVDGNPVQLDVPATIKNDRTFVPIRFISEKLGIHVGWNEASQSITLTN